MNPSIVFAAVAVLSFTGCASQPATYHPDKSRALNIAQAAGLWKAKDHAVPRDQREGLASAAFDITTGTALFNTPQGLGLSLGDAAALSVLSYFLAPPAQLERDTILAWVPSSDAAGKEQAVLTLSEQLYEASLAALNESGLSYRVDYHDRARKALLDTYYETRIAFTSEGHECGIRYQLFPREVSEVTDIPAFILPDQRGYRFWAAHEIRYPKLDIGCRDADPALGLQMAALISEKLPQGVFFYIASRTDAERKVASPPMILEQGQPLLFIKPEA